MSLKYVLHHVTLISIFIALMIQQKWLVLIYSRHQSNLIVWRIFALKHMSTCKFHEKHERFYERLNILWNTLFMVSISSSTNVYKNKRHKWLIIANYIFWNELSFVKSLTTRNKIKWFSRKIEKWWEIKLKLNLIGSKWSNFSSIFQTCHKNMTQVDYILHSISVPMNVLFSDILWIKIIIFMRSYKVNHFHISIK